MMVDRGNKISTFSIGEGYDCGRPGSLLTSNYRMLATRHFIHESAKLTSTVIIEPCFIGENVVITGSKIGPYVSVGKNTKISDSTISQSIIEQDSTFEKKDMSYTICSGRMILEVPDLTL